MPNTQQPHPTPLADAPRGEDYDKTTAALEPHIVAMQARIDRAARDHNVLLTQVAVMGKVAL